MAEWSVSFCNKKNSGLFFEGDRNSFYYTLYICTDGEKTNKQKNDKLCSHLCVYML